MDKGFSCSSQDRVDGHPLRPPKGDHPAFREAACGHLVPRGTPGLLPVFTGRPGLTAAHSAKRALRTSALARVDRDGGRAYTSTPLPDPRAAVVHLWHHARGQPAGGDVPVLPRGSGQ